MARKIFKKGCIFLEQTEKNKYTSQEKYDKANTKYIGLKLNINTDSDILKALEGKQKQTEIKRLIRIALNKGTV